MNSGTLARLLAAALLAAPLAACGEETTVDVSEVEPQESPVGDGPWLLRLTSLGEDEAIHQARYVWFTPATGDLEVVDAGAYFDSAVGREATLLVDSSRRWAVGASRPQWNDRPPQVYDLESGAKKAVAGGLGKLSAWSFDPDEAGILRVVTRAGKVVRVDVATGSTTEEEPLVEGADEYGYFFDVETGAPYVVSLDGGESRPTGLGDKPDAPVEVAGGQLLFGTGVLLPRGLQCQSAVGFAPGRGPTTVFCVRGDKLVLRNVSGETVGEVGRPVELGFQASEIDFALPPTP
jgi:hypothetical protein